jgi:DnaJ-class molecular chaperone
MTLGTTARRPHHRARAERRCETGGPIDPHAGLCSMSDRTPDPYRTLGVTAGASEAEVRAAYHRAVQLHHPDHNGGSVESARRFEAVQQAYAQIRALRGSRAADSSTGTTASGSPGQPHDGFDDPLDSRLAGIEQELKAARAARDRSRRAAREATSESAGERASDEELGYIRTDDSLSRILADAASELSERLSGAREHPVTKRVTDAIEDLEARLSGEPRKP